MKLAIITGADGGMGTEITREVARKGYHVVMACHEHKHAEQVREAIVKETGNENIEVICLDLANLESVAAFADILLKRGEPISLLMNNAGTLETKRSFTVDGLERTVSVNYVGPYLLTRKLVPLMEQGTRVVNMVSCTYALGFLNFPWFFTHGRKGSFWRIPVYSNSKLALSLFSIKLSRFLKEKGITVNAADPGVVSTKIITMKIWLVDVLCDIFFRPFILTPRQGADNAIRLLLEPQYEGQTGLLKVFKQAHPFGRKYQQHPKLEELWQRTEEIVSRYL